MARPSPDLAAARQRQVAGIVGQVVAQVQAIWHGLNAGQITEQLEGPAGRQILNLVIGGQLSVVSGAQAFVAAAVAAQNGVSAPTGALAVAPLLGAASDGRDLASLLYLPALTVAARRAAGVAADEAMLAGLAQMAMLTATQVADAARAADQVASVNDRSVVAYTRVVHLPACDRCIILAGQTYSVSTGFLRHPQCDCGVEALTRGNDTAFASPQELFDQMPPDEQRRVFGAAGAEAIGNGADIGQVVNARRGMATAHAPTTREGTTRRGWYAHRAGYAYRGAPPPPPRLTPGAILARTHTRAEAIAALRHYGYIT